MLFMFPVTKYKVQTMTVYRRTHSLIWPLNHKPQEAWCCWSSQLYL